MTGGLKQARILICNDDGIEARGIRVLEQAARCLSDDVWVIAPATEQSGKAHSFTAKGALNALKKDDRHFCVDGTPTDCVLFACNVLLKDHRPDFVFSGVNHGSNLGLDVLYSGTAGAAIEGTLQGIKSFAFSLYGAKHGSEYWPTLPELIVPMVEKTATMNWPKHTFLNINFPECAPKEVAGIQITRFSSRKIGDEIQILDRSDRACSFKIGYDRNGMIEENSDTYAVQHGFISVTPVCVDMTNDAYLTVLKNRFLP